MSAKSEDTNRQEMERLLNSIGGGYGCRPSPKEGAEAMGSLKGCDYYGHEFRNGRCVHCRQSVEKARARELQPMTQQEIDDWLRDSDRRLHEKNYRKRHNLDPSIGSFFPRKKR
jgi:hypothetical protein